MAYANPWMTLAFDTFKLGLEAQTVVGQRMIKAAFGGPRAQTENQLMLSEKIEAAFDLQAELLGAALTGDPHRGATRAVALYRRKVRANRRRLARGG